MFLKRVLSISASILLLALACPLGASVANASTIVSTFGPGDTYDVTSGYTIGDTQAIVQGLQFIPAETAVVQTIEIAAFRNAGGTTMNLALTNDAGDQPGSVLETISICCIGAVPSIHLVNSILRPLLTGGTKYWLVVSRGAAGDLFGWNRNFDLPFWLNAQQYSGGPWIVGLGWRGGMRISSDGSTPTKATTWGRLKSIYR